MEAALILLVLLGRWWVVPSRAPMGDVVKLASELEAPAEREAREQAVVVDLAARRRARASA